MKSLFARLVLAALLGGLIYPSTYAQNLFESDLGSQRIYEFTPSGTQSTFASSLHNPQGLAFNSTGYLFEADASSGDISEFTTNGTQSIFAAGLGKTRGLAFNSAGTLFVADNVSNAIYELTTNGAQSTFASGLNGTGGLAFNSAGDLFLADEGSGNIYEFTPGGAKTTFASGLNEPAGLAFDSAGDLFEADEGSGKIYEFTNGVATEKGAFATGLNEPTGLAFDGAGTLYVANQGTSFDIYEFTPAGVKSVFASGLNEPTYLAFQPFTPAFSGLASQSIPYETSGVTLSGTISGPGPVYPLSGETITVTINGNAQTTTTYDSTGDFSFTYNTSTFSIGGPYTITYAYGGDNWLLALGPDLAAVTDTSTTLAVTGATPAFNNLTATQFITNGTTAVTLTGTISAPGPIYPAQGEAIAVTINGNAQTTATTNSTGAFSMTYTNNLSALPFSASPYVITYAYPGDASLVSANDNSTALMVILAQNLFVSDPNTGNIYEFTNGLPTEKGLYASNLPEPQALAFNSAGVLFVAAAGNGTIYEIPPQGIPPGGQANIFFGGLNEPTGLAFNSAGNLFESDFGSGNIYELTPVETRSTFASGLDVPFLGLAFNSAGDLFEGDVNTGYIYEFTTSGAKGIFADDANGYGLTPAGALTFNSKGALLEADYSGNIYEFAANGTASVFATGLDAPRGMAFNRTGILFEADEGSSNIYAFTANGKRESPLLPD